MSEHTSKRKQPDHQSFENNAPKRHRQARKYKHRIHPKEAGHSIEDLPSLSLKTIESDRMGAAEILKSLGLEVSGAGKGAEMWFVGAGERTEDGEVEDGMSVEAKGISAGGTDGGERV